MNQSFPVYELIVLDDASDDSSVELIREELGKTTVKSRLLVNEANSGSVFEQWRKGALLAKGDFIWIAEADDYSDPEFISEVIEPFDDEDVVMSYCESVSIDSSGNEIDRDYRKYVADISASKWLYSYVNDGIDEIKTALSVKNTIPNVSSVIFRRRAFLPVLESNIEQIKQYKIAGDWLTYLYLLVHGKIAFTPKSYNYHRRHGSSVTLKGMDEKLLAEIISVQKIARETCAPDGADIRKSERYAQELYEQFGLNTKEHPSVFDNQKLLDLVK